MNASDAQFQRLSADRAEQLQSIAAGWLEANNFGVGDRLAIDHDGSVEYLALVMATLRVGVVPVPLPDTLPITDRDQMVADADVRSRVGRDDWAEIYAAHPGALGPIPITRPMLYTSGTTGRRKGVWFGIWTSDVARAAYLDEHDQWGFQPDDVHLICSPLYHSAPLRFAMHTLLAGGDVLLQPKFDARSTIDALVDGLATTSFVVPAHLQRIMELEPAQPSQQLRWIAHAGSTCPEALKRRVLNWLPPTSVWEFYGSTEAQFTACRGDRWLESPGTLGVARRGRDLLVDDEGLIWSSQPRFGRFEYWRDPVKTAATWRDDRCTVGDLGVLDDRGHLYLRGRREDLVVSGGVNVYPAEVERVMSEHPNITTCVAFGVDDEQWGQAVVIAWLGDADEDELVEFARTRLPPAARPRRYIQVEDFPTGTLGKVSRRRLADYYQAQQSDN